MGIFGDLPFPLNWIAWALGGLWTAIPLTVWIILIGGALIWFAPVWGPIWTRIPHILRYPAVAIAACLLGFWYGSIEGGKRVQNRWDAANRAAAAAAARMDLEEQSARQASSSRQLESLARSLDVAQKARDRYEQDYQDELAKRRTAESKLRNSSQTCKCSPRVLGKRGADLLQDK